MPSIEWSKKARKQVERIDRTLRPAIVGAVRGLANWPDCRNVKALAGREGFRLRVGRYRVLFTVHEGAVRIIRIEEVRKRDERTYH